MRAATYHECNTKSGTSQALGGGDGKTETGGEEDGDSGAKLSGETTGRAHLGDLVAEGTDDVVSEEPETHTEKKTSDSQHPDRGV